VSIQTYGLMLWADASNFIRFELGYGTERLNGTSIAAYYTEQGVGIDGPRTGLVSLSAVTKLRVERDSAKYAFVYSTDEGATWVTVPGSPLVVAFQLTAVGVFVINAGTLPPTSALIDSFVIE
jgi:hypothetical protein